MVRCRLPGPLATGERQEGKMSEEAIVVIVLKLKELDDAAKP